MAKGRLLQIPAFSLSRLEVELVDSKSDLVCFFKSSCGSALASQSWNAPHSHQRSTDLVAIRSKNHGQQWNKKKVFSSLADRVA
jgi:hypothetical protein